MPRLNPNQSVVEVLADLDDDLYQLPSIQRQFVWEETQILRLLDSVMCSYPIGAIIVWKPKKGIRCRLFTKNYISSTSKTTSDDPVPGEAVPYMVLDGQQRMQSLLLAFKGHYNDQMAYLRIDQKADESEFGFHYIFDFLTSQEAQANPAYVHVNELSLLRSLNDAREFVQSRLPEADLATRTTAEYIVGEFIQHFVKDNNILIQEIDDRHEYGEVLEIFERVNSGGTKLSKSDLIFSTVTLHFPDAEDRIARIVDQLNIGGFDFDTDFVIKAALVVFHQRAKYDHLKITKREFLECLAKDFDKFEQVITALRMWMPGKALIKGKRFLRSKLALIPLIDYLMINNKVLGPADGFESDSMKQYLYMSFFARLYSRAPDAVLDQIHDILIRSQQKMPGVFPIDEIQQYIANRKGEPYQFKDQYLWDLDLILNIIDGGVDSIPTQRSWSLDRDHIFPQHQLGNLTIAQDVHSVGNLRYCHKSRNIAKSDKMPDANTEFFGRDDPELQKLYQAACANLTQATFSAFVQKRTELIRTKVKGFLKLA